jgi:hypothetical protein
MDFFKGEYEGFFDKKAVINVISDQQLEKSKTSINTAMNKFHNERPD